MGDALACLPVVVVYGFILYLKIEVCIRYLQLVQARNVRQAHAGIGIHLRRTLHTLFGRDDDHSVCRS